jgi:tetratricopeptide (TPR) repeat protein
MRVNPWPLLTGVFLLASTALAAASSAYDRGVALFTQEEYKDSAKAFEEALQGDPKNADYLVWLGRAYGRRAERMTGLKALGALSLAGKVRESFEQAVEISPRGLVALQSLFDFYLDAPGIIGGGDDKAEALIPRIAKVDAAAGERAKAALFAKREDYPQAEASLRKAIELEPDDVHHRLSLASFLARRERYEESDRIFGEALQQKPDAPDVWYARARALVHAKRNPVEARRLLNLYLKTPLYAPDAEPYSDARNLLEEL